SSASPIDVKPGQQIDLQFTLKAEPVFQISGTIQGYSPEQGVSLQILDRSGDDLQLNRRINSQNGTFEVQMAPKGTYIIRATARDAATHILQAEAAVNVTANVTGVHLTLVPSLTIPLSVTTDFSSANQTSGSINQMDVVTFGGPGGGRFTNN